MADRISQRRQSANSFFLTINTVLLAFLGLVTKAGPGTTSGPSVIRNVASNAPLLWILAVSLAGLILCYFWYRLVCSYKGLNSGKFKVIHAMEHHLPVAPYDAEWEAVGRGKDPSLYLPFTNIETRIPRVFAALYVGFAIWNVAQAL